MRLRPIEHSYTKKHSLHVFFGILQLIYKENQTEPTVLFKTELKSKPNRTRGFSLNRIETELEKSIPHIPNTYILTRLICQCAARRTAVGIILRQCHTNRSNTR